MKNLTYIVKNMNCKHCVSAISKELEKIDLFSYEVGIGVVKVTIENNFNEELIIKAIEEAGYEIES